MMQTDITEDKPRLVFFQWQHDLLPNFLRLHMHQHVKCLSHFFDVILINKNCDYQQICETHEPDLVLFESGYRSSISRRLVITNTSSNPNIPKLGFHNGDAWCDCRVGFISDMDNWGIESYFSICATTAEHTPEIADKLFVWPNFIDSDVHRDYNQSKVVPVLFNGYINPLYPWRQAIYKIVSNCYPSLIFPHMGYEDRSPVMIYGEEYARTINSSWFVPACGTLAKEVVRKHFEIPGCRSCLVTEKTPYIEEAGFVDMENCVFADEYNVLDKLDHLYRNKDELIQIIDKGYNLVQSKHTLKQRDQIFQWFNLNRQLKLNQKIVQPGAFDALTVVDKNSDVQNTRINCNGLHLGYLKKGNEKLSEGKFEEAEALYLKCLGYIHWMAEPKLKLAICHLNKGDAEGALKWIVEPIMNNFRHYRAVDPDPVEWAYFILALLCKGNLNQSILRVNQFTNLSHPELDRVRWACHCLINNTNEPAFLGSLAVRRTIHDVPVLRFDDWVENLCNMLNACKQFQFADQLITMVNNHNHQLNTNEGKFFKARRSVQRLFLKYRITWLRKLSRIFEILRIPDPRPGLPPIYETEYIVRLSRCAKLNLVKRRAEKALSKIYQLYKETALILNARR
jgi:tetratricopeptide (TPR) repeat protein